MLLYISYSYSLSIKGDLLKLMGKCGCKLSHGQKVNSVVIIYNDDRGIELARWNEL